MTLKDVMIILCTTGKVTITDNADLYEEFDSSTDALLWVAPKDERRMQIVDMITPIVFEGDDRITTVITLKAK